MVLVYFRNMCVCVQVTKEEKRQDKVLVLALISSAHTGSGTFQNSGRWVTQQQPCLKASYRGAEKAGNE